ncbi:hypothetical protein GCM10023322_27840 [Rugosimonospora acidiphila]|uniref:DUF4233 domain-containing protein n=1 Tax=Rugosimonospora acidiphila TaxID=556531 RepID=A0ABP9RRX8_9ACTN
MSTRDGDVGEQAGGVTDSGGPQSSDAGTSGAGSDGAPVAEGPRSGLRNPAGAVRGVGAGALALEALVLLLAIVPLTKISTHVTGAAIGSVLALAALCVVLAGMLRRRWAWHAATVLQVALFACGLFHVALAVLGVLFGAVWVYVLYVRRSITG